ncbi:MAG: flagellin FliC3 [Lachnospiraceae bacterium]|nr:flagellin FliC3 [Lachnospiraceae bacterium]MBQ7767022.1 flagellin FliC3 [Lachnospiraceae bacterium]
MSLRVSQNISAITAQNALHRTDSKLSQSLERLSSGLKINHAKDNPAGVAIAKRMNSQIKGLSIAGDNASDAISIVETAEGAMSEIHAMLQRMNELAVSAANGTKNDEDREMIDAEIKQLKEEITRIAKDTEFNGRPLLDGGFDLRGYSSDPNVEVLYYSDEVAVKDYTISGIATSTDADGNLVVDSLTLLTAGDNAFPVDAQYEVDGDVVTIKAANDFEMKLKVKGAPNGAVNLDMTGIGAMRMQIGTEEGQVLEMRIPAISLELMGIENISIDTVEGANDAITRIEAAINYVSSARSRLGAYQNRLESTSASLDVTHENMTTSYSRIMDVDMAGEMTEYTNQQVLSQAGTSMLAQANERPQQVLQLLQ